jgi:two-component system, NarL family, nitrate/nitrite response regulator NarL
VSVTRILLAESNPLCRQTTAQILAKITGVTLVDKAGTSWEIMQLSAQLKPDVILMDLNLPGLNGVEAARAIRLQLPHVLIVMLINDASEHHINATRQSGACACLARSKLAQELPSLLENLNQADRAGASIYRDPLSGHQASSGEAQNRALSFNIENSDTGVIP